MITRTASKMAALFILSALSGCNLLDSKIVTVCEEMLQERLRSPSGYDRVEVKRYEDKMTRAEYQAYLVKDEASADEIEFKTRMFDQGLYQPTVFTIYIHYDAPNAYGTPIRDLASCEYFDDDADESNASSYSVKVNGKTKTDWIVEQIRASKG
jgi:hypothetical protein